MGYRVWVTVQCKTQVKVYPHIGFRGYVSRLSYLDREYETLPTANYHTTIVTCKLAVFQYPKMACNSFDFCWVPDAH